MKYIKQFLLMIIEWIILIIILGFCRFFHGQSFNYIMLILFILVIDQINKIFRTHWIRKYRSNWFRVLIYLLRIIFLIVISIVISHLDLEKIYSVSIIYWIYFISIIIAIILTEPRFKLRLYVPDNDEEKQVLRPNFNKPIELYIFANRGKKYRYLGITPLEYIKERKVSLVKHIYDTSYCKKQVIDFCKVPFVSGKNRFYLNLPHIKKLFNTEKIGIIIEERTNKEKKTLYYYRLGKRNLDCINKHPIFFNMIAIPVLLANGLGAIVYGVCLYFHKYIKFLVNSSVLIKLTQKFGDVKYKVELTNKISMGFLIVYLVMIFWIFTLPFWTEKFDEFVKKLGIVITLFLDFAACIIIPIFLEGRGLNDHFSFFCLIVWIIFNIIEVIILIYKWMLEDKNTGGIPRTQLIMTIIFGILSFIVGKLWR